MILKYKCTNAVRFAFLDAPIEEIIAVTQEIFKKASSAFWPR